MLNFKPNRLTLALLSSGFMALSLPALAEEVADEKVKAKKSDVEVITVTGIRGSLQRAQAIKMSSNSIVEVLSAEDIGKLPDTSVAESLARLPGVTGERRNGRTSGLSVRGFNENYVGTSLNGRELLGMGDNRGVEYDLYPTEIVSNIIVYKTPEAGLVSQGIGGTVDLQTVSPLNSDAVMAFNANFEKNKKDSANPDYDNDGHRLSFNYVDKFMDDTLGLALVLSSLETPRQEENFRAWGYADTEDGNKILGGHDSFVRSALLERDSIAAIVEYAPTDALKIQFDALYIDFSENDVRRGLEEGGPVWGGTNYTESTVEDGLVTSGYWDGFHSVVRNDARTQDSKLTTFGLNVEYVLSDNWTAELDISTGSVEKSIIDVESYSGVGRANTAGRPSAARSWEMTSTGVMYSDHPTLPGVDYTDESLMRLAGPQAWGAPIIGSDAQDGFINRPEFEENLDSVRFQVNGFLEYGIISGIEAGILYSDRKKEKINEGDYLTAPEYPNDGPIPNVLGVADLGFVGIDGVLAYDSIGLYKNGYYKETAASLVQTDRLGDTYTVKEEQLSAYVKLNLEAEFGDILMSGNIGLQVVNVDQESTGYIVVENATGYVNATKISGGDSYSDVLPTLNLSFEIAENQFIRTAMGKVLSRPRMDDMRPNFRKTFAFNDNQIKQSDADAGPWSGGTGNPTLKPLEANQFDLSYENYFTDDGYFAATFFYKDLKNWHRSGQVLTDYSDVYIPGYHQSQSCYLNGVINDDNRVDNTSEQLANCDAGGEHIAPAGLEGFVDSTEDGLTGFVRGYELQASVPFRLIHENLTGFGIAVSATFLDGELEDGARIPGLSEESYSLTAYYEHKGFEFRIAGTKRDEFLTETRGQSLALDETEDLGSEIWDAQISYDFKESGISSLEGLRITLQAQNITDEDTLQAEAADSRQIKSYQSFGANYSLGLNYKF
ncbi:TonB-dependent receptor [Colwellia sp. Arc7-635]|uniref:TonB-dependent receptor n=1 Tax=Colwellia sp. Arc7-635 TaxID=2497879 RepID=UPI000F85AD67|nr:TonB-dependent receptor [Colwellia sp. Arc7-635]AZQ84014.1 TonB-dependent receptor [Colwellia sp. Arc7-635]